MNYDLLIVGGGPAGMASAISARKNGIEKILILERDKELGGILFQCIHNGFGLHIFNEELTGPEYAERYAKEIESLSIEYMLDTMVIDIDQKKNVTAVNKTNGLMKISAKSIILAMGCRERTRGMIALPGSRPAGVFSAGTAQRYINIEGYMVGKKIIILGSGDIGLIMARRLTLEGAKVLAVVEIMNEPSGLIRNVVQCLDDFDIPLLLNRTVSDIKGMDRVSSLVISKVDENLKIIEGTEIEYECDTLLLSVGLIPENELSKKMGLKICDKTSGPIIDKSMQTSLEGVFACGNVAHVLDLVDHVSKESALAGESASMYIKALNQKIKL